MEFDIRVLEFDIFIMSDGKNWAILIVVTLLAIAVLYGVWPRDKDFFQATGFVNVREWYNSKIKTGKILEDKIIDLDKGLNFKIMPLDTDEKQKIDKWLEENNFNKYGDSKDTVYIGGTPLFDEKTGMMKDRYEYLLEKFPDRPWNQEE